MVLGTAPYFCATFIRRNTFYDFILTSMDNISSKIRSVLKGVKGGDSLKDDIS